MVLSMIKSAYERWLESEDGQEKQAFLQDLREQFPIDYEDERNTNYDYVHYRARTKALESSFLRCAQELAKRTDELNYYRRRYGNALNAIAEIAELTHSIATDTDEVEE